MARFVFFSLFVAAVVAAMTGCPSRSADDDNPKITDNVKKLDPIPIGGKKGAGTKAE